MLQFELIAVYPPKKEATSNNLGSVSFTFRPGIAPVKVERYYKAENAEKGKNYPDMEIIEARAITIHNARILRSEKGNLFLGTNVKLDFADANAIASAAVERLNSRR